MTNKMELSEQQKLSFRNTPEYKQMKSMLPACDSLQFDYKKLPRD